MQLEIAKKYKGGSSTARRVAGSRDRIGMNRRVEAVRLSFCHRLFYSCWPGPDEDKPGAINELGARLMSDSSSSDSDGDTSSICRQM